MTKLQLKGSKIRERPPNALNRTHQAASATAIFPLGGSDGAKRLGGTAGAQAHRDVDAFGATGRESVSSTQWHDRLNRPSGGGQHVEHAAWAAQPQRVSLGQRACDRQTA